MDNPIHQYWEIRLKKLKKALEANNFDVYIAENKDLAKKIAYNTIIPAISPENHLLGRIHDLCRHAPVRSAEKRSPLHGDRHLR
jgi:hypothetical protein